MYLVKSPGIVKKYYPRLIWDIPNDENKIFLTFDDGPAPEITEWVLDVLAKYKIRATFFCLGCNTDQNTGIYLKIINSGHAVGNHSYHHINGWDTNDEKYLSDIKKTNELLNAKLFRPPYGRIKKSQISALIDDYKLIMWDVLSGDFDSKITPEKCYKNVIKNTKSGSVIVFHDSLKASENLKYALPKAIAYLLEQGFKFDVIPED